MKTNEETIGLVSSHASETTKDICRSLAKKGISSIVVQKDTTQHEAQELADQHHWSGQPGKDLFFNGWKLMF
jgi:hypothetical protein